MRFLSFSLQAIVTWVSPTPNFDEGSLHGGERSVGIRQTQRQRYDRSNLLNRRAPESLKNLFEVDHQRLPR